MTLRTVLFVWLPLMVALPGWAGNGPRPDLLLVTVDTLRSDHLSSSGYERPTSPEIDSILASGVSFSQARTVEPLTNPALVTILTSMYPHEHGASRNGLPMRPGLLSLPQVLERVGYRTAAFVGSWVLRDRLSGLAEHFEHYEEVLTRRRWLGLVRRESTAEDLVERLTVWLEEGSRSEPVFLWIHFVEPHAPYRLQAAYTDRLGLPATGLSKIDRYDTEIAYVDEVVGKLVRAVAGRGRRAGLMTVFTSDHGESLGEHSYWGHGRNLYEPSLLVPLGIAWPGHVEPRDVKTPASLLDVAPTVLGLMQIPVPDDFRGFDWTGVLSGDPEPEGRPTLHQAHRGAVQSLDHSERKRRRGLLAVGRVAGNRKEILHLGKEVRGLFDLGEDPAEQRSLVADGSRSSEQLILWRELVESGLRSVDQSTEQELTSEDVEQLRALGYLD